MDGTESSAKLEDAPLAADHEGTLAEIHAAEAVKVLPVTIGPTPRNRKVLTAAPTAIASKAHRAVAKRCRDDEEHAPD